MVAIIDTGFEGEIALPKDFYKLSNRKNSRKINLDLATGSTKLNLTTEEVLFFQENFEAEIVWLDYVDEPLIGSGFFYKNLEFLVLDYKRDQVRLRL